VNLAAQASLFRAVCRPSTFRSRHWIAIGVLVSLLFWLMKWK
jgi:hypothetical protein